MQDNDHIRRIQAEELSRYRKIRPDEVPLAARAEVAEP